MSETNTPRGHPPELEPELEAAVQAVLSEQVPAEAIARVKARAAALRSDSEKEAATAPHRPETHFTAPAAPITDQTFPTPIPVPFLSRSFIMKCTATVAAIVLVVGTTLFLQSSPNAYAEAIKQLREARSFSYVKRISVDGAQKPIEVKIMVAEDGRQRQEQSGGTITIMDPSPQIRLTLMTATKTAIVSEPHAFPAKAVAKHPLEWLNVLKSHGDKPDKHLGKKMLDGRQVEGFVTMQAVNSYTVWIDSQTHDLVEIEHEMPVKGSSITKIVMSDFRFNEKLDESLFSYDVPEGYKTINRKRLDIPKSAGGETGIIETLRGFTRKSAGKFPNSITNWGEFVTLKSQVGKDGQFDKETTELMTNLGGIIPFLTALPKSDYEYLGAGKTVDDERCIVFWYRNKNKTLRAIYNDFSVADVQESDIK